MSVFNSLDVSIKPLVQDMKTVKTVIAKDIDEESSVLYAGKFFQYTANDRSAWNALVLRGSIPRVQAIGNSGPCFARTSGLSLYAKRIELPIELTTSIPIHIFRLKEPGQRLVGNDYDTILIDDLFTLTSDPDNNPPPAA